MINYANIKSTYVKRKIEGRSYGNKQYRSYIDELIILERYIMNPPQQWGGNMHYGYLKNRYPTEWKEIFLELKPEEFRRSKEDKTDLEKEVEREVRNGSLVEKRARRDWIAQGGRK